MDASVNYTRADKGHPLNAGRTMWLLPGVNVEGGVWYDLMDRLPFTQNWRTAWKWSGRKFGVPTWKSGGGSNYGQWCQQFPYNAGPFSYACWYDTTGRNTSNCLMGDERSNNPLVTHRFFVWNSKVYIRLRTSNGTYELGGSTTMGNGWYHLAGTWDGNFARVYVNGVQDGVSGTIGTLLPPAIPVFNVGYNYLWGDWAGGQITDLGYWRRCLSPGEIKALMRAAQDGWPGMLLTADRPNRSRTPPLTFAAPPFRVAGTAASREPLAEYVW